MAWGAQNANSPDGDYLIKLAWLRSDVAKAIGDDTVAGFQFSDPVQFDKNIHIPNANGELSFAKTNLSGNATTSPYPYFGQASGNAGFAYGSRAVYMVQDGNWIRVVNTHDPFKPDGGASQNLQFRTMVSNNTYYPALTNQAGKVGILFGSTELYLMRDGKPYPLSGILK